MTKRDIGEFLKYFVIALAITIPIKLWVAQPFLVSGDSMIPTFDSGEYLIVDEFSYHFRTPERFEVVIFRFPEDPKKFFIKRVIGLPGETVSIKGSRVTITTSDGEELALDEAYVEETGINNLTTELGELEYFVMGDNRAQSSDSRLWGPVDEELMVGRVFVRLYPLTDISLLPGQREFEEVAEEEPTEEIKETE